MPYKPVQWTVEVPDNLLLRSESRVTHIVIRSIGGKRRARMEVSTMHGGAEVFGLPVAEFIDTMGTVEERIERRNREREEHNARMRMIASGRLLGDGSKVGSADNPEVLPALPSGVAQERVAGSDGPSTAPESGSASGDTPDGSTGPSETSGGPKAKSDEERAREYPPDKTIAECLEAIILGGNQRIPVPDEFSETLDFDSETFVCLECLRRNKLIELTEAEKGNS